MSRTALLAMVGLLFTAACTDPYSPNARAESGPVISPAPVEQDPCPAPAPAKPAPQPRPKTPYLRAQLTEACSPGADLLLRR
ncbi:MAG TPA: hypothetical protein VNJ71_04405 [Gemmatimonadales bacterium]|jgi:hypothetical protein|nr:hypothetical protein [Gemmatimonadales bacterium]